MSGSLVIKLITLLVALFGIFWGVWASFEAKKPFNIIGAIVAPIALIMALLSVLLIFVPGFFT